MIYLDNNATTRIDPIVFEEMKPFLTEMVGNPSSIHRYGQKAKGVLIDAQKRIADFFGVRSDEILFTSGATEALNFLIRSVPKGGHVITSSLEHVAVLEPLKYSACSVSYVDHVTVRAIEEVLQPDTEMLVFMAANNETGILTEIAPIAHLAEEMKIPLIVDGVALLGKEPFSIPQGVSAICFSGHKIHAPMGVGVAIVRHPFRPHPFIVGGPQQRGWRGGTVNLPGIVGFAKALDLIEEGHFKQMRKLRDRFERGILESLEDVVIHGVDQHRLSNTSNIAFLGVDGETLLMSLDLHGIAASHGSACSSGTLEPSRVLLNMGVPKFVARSSLRFSLSRFTTEEEIDRAVVLIADVVRHLRCLAL